jgi:hypothetical protein
MKTITTETLESSLNKQERVLINNVRLQKHWTGGVPQVVKPWLASMKPWVRPPVPQKKEKKKRITKYSFEESYKFSLNTAYRVYTIKGATNFSCVCLLPEPSQIFFQVFTRFTVFSYGPGYDELNNQVI